MSREIAPSLAPWQYLTVHQPYDHFAMLGGIACVRGSTLVETSKGKVPIKDLRENDLVWTISDQGPKLSRCSNPFRKGKANLYRVVHEQGEFVAHGLHLVSLASGNWKHVQDLCEGEGLLSFSQTPPQSNSVHCQKSSPLNAHRYCKKLSDYLGDYEACIHLCGQQLLFALSIALSFFQRLIGAHILSRSFFCQGGLSEQGLRHSHLCQRNGLHDNKGSFHHEGPLLAGEAGSPLLKHSGQILGYNLSSPQFDSSKVCRPLSLEWVDDHEHVFSCSNINTSVLSITRLDAEEEYWDIEIPETGNYIAEGVVHHNTGKSYTGAHFVIDNIMHRPELTGFIGANTYDQLNQASLKELFYWFGEYGIEYVVDKIPPSSWKAPKLKKYHNVITTYFNGKATIIFTRVLSNADPLRGIEFSWYWLDETRDTPEYTHDVILGRMRESNYAKGIITTTTNGEDWMFKRFVRGMVKGDFTYGAMHVPTTKSLEYGIITEKYFNTLVKSYSPLMAQQEIYAKHVNILGGQAYYAASDVNRRRQAPWGNEFPSTQRELIIGCDFNYAPAPCIWMVGQRGPHIIDPHTGISFNDMIHWFGEVSDTQVSTVDMAKKLVANYPGFFYQVFGDASGNRETTSNAAETDYIQLQNTLDDLGCNFSIDVDQGNPRVKDRVEAMNAMFKNGLGQIRMTYNPDTCPYFDGDVKSVGWKQPTYGVGNAKLSDGGDVERTHATDGAGYAVYKLFPVGRRATIIDSVPSNIRANMPV